MRASERVGGYALAATALIACPCHLVLLVPPALGLLGGTALGAMLAAHRGWVIAAATVYFVGALAGGIYLLTRQARDEEGSPAPSPGRGCRAPISPRARSAHGMHEKEANG